jgi:hypothetical protein
MRTRDKQRIFRRFMAGDCVAQISARMKHPYAWEEKHAIIEAVLREGATGKFAALPMKQARAKAKAASDARGQNNV